MTLPPPDRPASTWKRTNRPDIFGFEVETTREAGCQTPPEAKHTSPKTDDIAMCTDTQYS